jgi:hypothetical protein
MAPDQNKSPSGGNKPKPANPPTGKPGQSAKDKSRAQSRTVSAKAPTGRSGKAGGGGNSTTSYTPVTPAPASVVNDVSNIPLSVYNKIGVTSSTAQVVPPTVLKNQPPMTLDGKTPAMLYYGAEYCPYCAAERWAMTTALSRFGTWSGLKITASSHTDVDAMTHTFSYYGATLTSPYINFTGIEQYSNVPIDSGQGWATLQNPTKQEAAILTQYSSSKYNPNTSSSGGISFPFVDINNVLLFSGASYDPGILAGQTWSQIAGNLSDASNPATQAIVAVANYMSAGICASSKDQPASVCNSPGVQAANKALKLS